MKADDYSAESLSAWLDRVEPIEPQTWYERNYLWVDKVFVITLVLGRMENNRDVD